MYDINRRHMRADELRMFVLLLRVLYLAAINLTMDVSSVRSIFLIRNETDKKLVS